jgi:hypothetical protein
MSIAAGAIALVLAGCSYSTRCGSSGFPPPGAAMVNGKPSPPPMVWDCAMTSAASPGKFICNCKQYTSFDLYRMRKDYEKQQAAGM